jgi:hypothetical protein
MSETKEKDLKMEKLPDIEFHTSYNQVTNLFQHQNGVFKKPQNMTSSMECMILRFLLPFRFIWVEKLKIPKKSSY